MLIAKDIEELQLKWLQYSIPNEWINELQRFGCYLYTNYHSSISSTLVASIGMKYTTQPYKGGFIDVFTTLILLLWKR